MINIPMMRVINTMITLTVIAIVMLPKVSKNFKDLNVHGVDKKIKEYGHTS